MISLLRSRKGDAYAWFAALMIFVGVPLASLSIDVTRMMYVRGHLQTASDAACQAAVDALDVLAEGLAACGYPVLCGCFGGKGYVPAVFLGAFVYLVVG